MDASLDAVRDVLREVSNHGVPVVDGDESGPVSLARQMGLTAGLSDRVRLTSLSDPNGLRTERSVAGVNRCDLRDDVHLSTLELSVVSGTVGLRQCDPLIFHSSS